jgi:hypothetical protein
VIGFRAISHFSLAEIAHSHCKIALAVIDRIASAIESFGYAGPGKDLAGAWLNEPSHSSIGAHRQK